MSSVLLHILDDIIDKTKDKRCNLLRLIDGDLFNLPTVHIVPHLLVYLSSLDIFNASFRETQLLTIYVVWSSYYCVQRYGGMDEGMMVEVAR